MTRYTFSYKSLIIGFGLLGMLALVAVVFLQATIPTSAARYGEGLDAVDFTDAETLAGVHPADRKFYTHHYATGERATTNTYLLAGVHPADRKFFTGVYEMAIVNVEETRAQAEAEAADRKLQDPGYLKILMEQAAR